MSGRTVSVKTWDGRVGRAVYNGRYYYIKQFNGDVWQWEKVEVLTEYR